jgi:hypothetical protein
METQGLLGVGSDPSVTIWRARSGDSGMVYLDGLMPGEYYMRAESDSHIMVGGQEGRLRNIVVEEGVTSRYVVICGELCVAALRVSVPSDEVLYSHIEVPRGHAITAAIQDAIDAHREKTEERFVGSQVSVAVSMDVSGHMGYAKFYYWTLNHGRFSVEVPYVRLASFDKPDSFLAPRVDGVAVGDVVFRVVGDQGVDRKRLRIELKQQMRSVEGIICREGEPRAVPVGEYVIDCHDRELASAIEMPARIAVAEGVTQEVVLRVRDGLVPLKVHIDAPETLRDHYRWLELSGTGVESRRIRTKGSQVVVWLEPGAYELTARLHGCKSIATAVVVPQGGPAVATIVMESNR